jgi:hypothetical protein
MNVLSKEVTEGSLRVWWIPQVPGKQFLVDVRNFEQAKLLLNVLADYDIFQLKNNVKPDYCNAGGLQVLEAGEWVDYWTEDGLEFDDLSMEDCIKLDMDSV